MSEIAAQWCEEHTRSMECEVKVIRYADEIVVLAKSKRVGERLLESSKYYLGDS